MDLKLSKQKQARIRAMGGRITTVEEWLDLTPEEVAIIDMKIRLGNEIRDRRRKRRLPRESVAKNLETSQARVSKLEQGIATLDQLAHSVLVLGGSREEVGRAISG